MRERITKDVLGQDVNRAKERSDEAARRADYIRRLGMAPEKGERYAATIGELLLWVRQAGLANDTDP